MTPELFGDVAQQGRFTLGVALPVRNERENLPLLLDRIVAVGRALNAELHVVIADDCSDDGTTELYAPLVARYHWLTVVRLSRRFGHQAAVTAALSRTRGDAIVAMDADLQDPPEVIPDLVARWREGFEVVTAVKRSRRDPLLRRVAYWLFHRLLPYALPLPIPATAGTFCLLDARAAREIVRLGERNRFLPGLRSWVGFRQATVPYDRMRREAGEPLRIRDLVKLAADAVLGFSYRPLRLVTVLGLAEVVVALVVLAAALPSVLAGGAGVPGWVGLAATISFFGGIQLFALGLVGEYVARIADEAVGRPYYVIRDVLGADPAGLTDVGH